MISARAKVVAGVVTSILLDVPSGEGKAESLIKAGITNPDVVFGNSIHDAAMLAIAQQAYPVNPTPALLAVCQTEVAGLSFTPRGPCPA